MPMEPVLERVARVEGRMDEHSRTVEDIARRFTNVETRFDRVEASLNDRFNHVEGRLDRVRDELDGRIDRLDRKATDYFTWMIGVTLASWLSLMYQVSRAAR